MESNHLLSEFLRRLTISQKLIISYLLIGIIMLSVVYYFYYDTTKKAIITRTHNQLSSVMNLKRGWLESYFANQKVLINHFTTYYTTQITFSELDISFRKHGPKSKSYRLADSLFGGAVQQFKMSNNFKNIWLVNTDGDIIYTSIQNGYLGKNVNDTVFFCSTLKHTFFESFQAPAVGDLISLSKSDSASYVAIVAPIKDYSNNLIGFILVKLNMDVINNILVQRSGMGKTGESYVVDNQFVMRSISRFYEKNTGEKIFVKTPGVELALSGKEGQGLFTDYRGFEVLSCYTKIRANGLNWVLLSEIDLEEAMQPVYELNRRMLIVGIIITIALVLITIYLAGRISGPIKNMNLKINQLAKGVLPTENIEVQALDEIGQITISINHLVDALKKTTAFAGEIGSGNFLAEFSPLSDKDVLGFSLIEMRDRLSELSKLVEQQNRLKTLSLIEGQENERRRISRELHDGVGQMLTALKFKVQELNTNDPIVKTTKDLLDETIQEVRRVSVNLVPSVLYDFGIEAAIKVLIKSVDLSIEFTSNSDANSVEPDLEKRICLYRITQEAIQNIQKYAKTDKVRIHIEYLQDAIDLLIMDYGKGFDISQSKKNNLNSNGLRNMQERATLVGGTFEIESAKNKGTKIVVNIPL